MVRPDGDEKDVDEFETLDEEAEEADEFESVGDSDAEEPEPEGKVKGSEDLMEFESFDDTGPDEIETSGMKTKGGQIPGYEPTVDEVLSFALGKTKDPSEEPPPRLKDKSVGESLSSILSKSKPSPEGGNDEGDEEARGEEDDLVDIFGDDEDEGSEDEGDDGDDEDEK